MAPAIRRVLQSSSPRLSRSFLGSLHRFFFSWGLKLKFNYEQKAREKEIHEKSFGGLATICALYLL
jgi:hypothetical protein